MPRSYAYKYNAQIRWYLNRLIRGQSYDDIDAAYRAKFPNEGPVELGLVRQEAIAMQVISGRMSMLTGDMPLSTVLAGKTPPADVTYVNARITYYAVSDPTDESLWQYREVQWRGPWDTPFDEIMADLEDQGEAIMSRAFGESPRLEMPVDMFPPVIDSTPWFPHPEQE
jgi:hypothetical protein